MTPKELIDKITLAAEQLESLRTEYDLPVIVQIGDECIRFVTSNKKHYLEFVIFCDDSSCYARTVGGRTKFFNTYEELVEDIR